MTPLIANPNFLSGYDIKINEKGFPTWTFLSDLAPYQITCSGGSHLVICDVIGGWSVELCLQHFHPYPPFPGFRQGVPVL